jgi:hypothetical protein
LVLACLAVVASPSPGFSRELAGAAAGADGRPSCCRELSRRTLLTGLVSPCVFSICTECSSVADRWISTPQHTRVAVTLRAALFRSAGVKYTVSIRTESPSRPADVTTTIFAVRIRRAGIGRCRSGLRKHEDDAQQHSQGRLTAHLLVVVSFKHPTGAFATAVWGRSVRRWCTPGCLRNCRHSIAARKRECVLAPAFHALIWQHQRERVRIREERAPEALAP